MKNIFYLTSTLKLGGSEMMLCEIARRLDRKTFKIKICCLYGPGHIGNTLISEGIDVSHSLMRNKYDIRGLIGLFCLLKRERPDLLFIEALPLSLFLGLLLGRLLKTACIVATIQKMMDSGWQVRLKAGLIDRIILPRLDGIIAASKSKARSIIKGYNLKPERIKVVHNAIDIDRFTSMRNGSALRREIGIRGEDRIVGMVGRLVHEKAYDVFLESAARILSRVKEAHFLIIGEGIERVRLERMSCLLGINEHVRFLGERTDIARLIPMFDVAVLSSRAESSPLALLEYMAASRPIVATNVGGNKEIIINGVSGILVPSEEPDELAGAVVELLYRRDKAKRMGMAARESVKRSFSIEKAVDEVEKFFMGCIDRQIPGLNEFLSRR